MQRALQAQSSFDMRPRRADEFQKGRPTAPAIPRVKQMAQFFQSKQVKSMQRNSDRYLELPSHHWKIQKDGWAKYIPNFPFKGCYHDRRTLENKNGNTV